MWWHELIADQSADCPAEQMDAEDTLFVLYTSGSTGKPKGILHTTGGYIVGTNITCRYVFDLRDEDVYWCSADVGWITGHSYVVYGPLSCGATVLMYEGAATSPTSRDSGPSSSAIKSACSTPRRPPSAFHARRPGSGRRARSPLPAIAGDRWRADQSRGVDVVSRSDRT